MNDFQLQEQRKTQQISEKYKNLNPERFISNQNNKFKSIIEGGNNVLFGKMRINKFQNFSEFDKNDFIGNKIILNNNNKEKEVDINEKINNLINNYKNQLDTKYKEERKIILKISENEDYSHYISLFQCFANLHDLLLYLQKNIDLLNNPEKFPFSFSFFRIIYHLYNNNNNSENNPNKDIISFIKVIGRFYPFLNKNKNPIDLFSILINDLHNELNQFQKYNNTNCFSGKKVDKRNAYEVINYAITNFNQNNATIISKFFTLFCKREIKCIKCKNIYYELQNFISFDIDPINTYKKYKKNNLTINDCLTYYLSPSTEKVICSLCNKLCKLSIQKKIYSPPSNLVLVINRNNEEEEKELLDIKIKYEEILDISYFIDKKVDFKAQYILISVVALLYDKNKFVSFCKKIFHNNEWECFDDESIKECNYDYMVNNSSPYILFYKKLD